MFTKEEIKLAPLVNKALEKLRVECPTCAGRGRESVIGDYAMGQTSQKCLRCNGTGKVKWKWEPKWGDLCIWEGKLAMVNELKKDSWVEILPRPSSTTTLTPLGSLIPLLYWERLEKILEELGFGMDIVDWKSKNTGRYGARMYKGLNFFVDWHSGKTRQEAVQRAAIRLGEDYENKTV